MIDLILPLPPSVNRLYGHGPGRRPFLAAEHVAWRETVGWLARAAGLEPVAAPVAVLVDFHRRRRVGDVDNILKTLLDGLSGVAWRDDRDIDWLLARRFDDPVSPRVRVRAWHRRERGAPAHRSPSGTAGVL